ncbi:MAG: FeoB-associated Cys-rich membrane protein [Lachnospiraceae bacterium]|nr:FeoB-associated Cys-rich membrane protein [Lachnospiraceae bacterium]
MANIIAGAAVILIVGAACRYIYKEKKNGRKCIGCPHCNEMSCNCNQR